MPEEQKVQMTEAVILVLIQSMMAFIQNAPAMIAAIQEMVQAIKDSAIPNKDDLLAQIKAAQDSWPEWV
jgi:hypothetical protein